MSVKIAKPKSRKSAAKPKSAEAAEKSGTENSLLLEGLGLLLLSVSSFYIFVSHLTSHV